MTDCRTRYPILLVHGLNCRDEVPFFYWGRVPELLAGAFVVITYLKRRSLLLSIGGGTALYMALVQVVFGSFFA